MFALWQSGQPAQISVRFRSGLQNKNTFPFMLFFQQIINLRALLLGKIQNLLSERPVQFRFRPRKIGSLGSDPRCRTRKANFRRIIQEKNRVAYKQPGF